MWYVVMIDGIYHAIIDKSGKVNKYGQPKLFPTKKKAQEWVDRKSYKGMSFRYEIKKQEV